jgi:predicted amidohydrolase
MTAVTSVQLDISENESKEDRVQRTAGVVKSLSGADLVVLPEMWNVGYLNFDRYAECSEPIDGPTVTAIAESARSIGAWVLAGSIVEADGGSLFNTSVLLDRRGDVVSTYRKMHLFGYGSQEPKILDKGSEVTVVDTEFGRTGLSTCYDLRFPELFRAMIDEGAELFLVPSAWPYPRVEAWATLNQARALENQAWLISANCSGGTKGGYCGRSMIVDPWGTVVASAGDRPGTVSAEIDVDAVRNARREFPLLEDRVLFRSEGS